MIDTSTLYLSLAHTYETLFPVVGLIFIIGIGMYFFQDELSDNYWERQRLFKSIATFTALPIMATVGYLVIKGFTIWLAVGLILILTVATAYFFGLFDEWLHQY